jgi:hypothetical protein
MKLDKAELREVINALGAGDEDLQSMAVASMTDFLSKVRRQMDDGDVVDISAVIEG